jgi:hypothetical protein
LGRFCRKTFRDTIQLDFAIGKVLYVPGGRIPSLLYVWKLPSPAHRSEKSNLELHRRILNHKSCIAASSITCPSTTAGVILSLFGASLAAPWDQVHQLIYFKLSILK